MSEIIDQFYTMEKVEAKKDALKFFDIAINCN